MPTRSEHDQHTYDNGDRQATRLEPDAERRTVTYSYDSGGRLVQVTDANGGVTRYTYDTSNRMLTVTDPRNIVKVTNQYDANGRVTLQTLADASTYRFTYMLDRSGNVKETDITNPRGILRKMTFSGGYTVTDTLFVSNKVQQQTTYTRQAGTNLVLSVTDPLSRQTSYSYDSCGNITGITRLAGTAQAVTTTLAYQTAAPGTLTDPAGSWQFGYTSDDLTAITDPIGRTSTRVVDKAHHAARK